MCVATIYGRYHYVADVLAGIVVGAIGWAAGQWVMEREGAVPPSGGRGSKYFFRAEERAHGAEIGDAEDTEILIFTADIAERKSAVFERRSAARAVVANFGNLVLE